MSLEDLLFWIWASLGLYEFIVKSKSSSSPDAPELKHLQEKG